MCCEIRDRSQDNEHMMGEKKRGKWRESVLKDERGRKRTPHLGQVVDGDREEENQGTVEKNFAQTNHQASSLYTRLHAHTQNNKRLVSASVMVSLQFFAIKNVRKADIFPYTQYIYGYMHQTTNP